MALGSTQPLTEMITRCISWGKGGRCVRLTTLPPSCAVVMKCENLNFLEPSGPLEACNGTALPLLIYVCVSSLQRQILLVQTHDTTATFCWSLCKRGTNFLNSEEKLIRYIYSFIHSVFCLTTGRKPPPKRCLHIVRFRASSFK